jgi:uroporphyrinogen III methyltransferase/synthase
MRGKVYLVGAGPGDPGLLTLRALEVLREADVVIYDRLITEEILRLIPKRIKKVYVGKRLGKHTWPQDRINELMIEEAKKGKKVVRLKGGDPFLLGRGGEEAQAVARAGVTFEIVPGVTSALAAPAYAGIPLTHRDYASSVAIATGHEDPTKPEPRVDWEGLATSVDTIVVLMGIKELPKITKRLLKKLKPETEVALIEWGTTKHQRTVTGSLADIVEKAEEAGVKAPAVIVVGDVVKMRKELAWFLEKAA